MNGKRIASGKATTKLRTANGGMTVADVVALAICIVVLVMTIAMLVGCSKEKSTRSVYYWRTTLSLDSTERAFIEENGVSKIYCRYFDVVMDDNGEPMPNATISFEDTFPHNTKVVPVVYILNDCMKDAHDGLAKMIFERIRKMNDTNGIHGTKEIQIDCDWSQSTKKNFFTFMSDLQRLCHSNEMRLSATIRLHQLGQPAPPCDRGVLMMYNTGDVTKLSVCKPILDIHDVQPYMRYLKSYDLSLSTAYPLFSWRVLFRGDKYVGIMHGDDDLPVLPGDSIAERQPTSEDILQTQRAVDKMRPDANNEIILYDLSRENIKRFKRLDYENFYKEH